MTHFDYLLKAFEQASQADNPGKEGYAEKRRALLAYVRELESYKQDAERYRWLRNRIPGSAYRIECQGQPGYDIPCSCGYDELMKELEESK